MKPQDLIAFRTRVGWGRAELAGRLEISASRLADYELGHTRGKNPQPAPIPRLVELACAWFDEHEGKNWLLTPAERAALWRDFVAMLPPVDHVIDDSRWYLPRPSAAVTVLVDTNLLLRQFEPEHAHRRSAVDVVTRLLLSGEPVHVTAQNIAEFWAAATRSPAQNGLGLAIAVVAAALDRIERVFALLPDEPAIHAVWRRLVMLYGAIGNQVYDARLVAAMRVHGVGRILTFNATDFAHYGIDVLHPSAVS